MKEEQKNIVHPSFATVALNRVSSTGTTLFDSPLKHQHFIKLSIHKAHKVRHLNQDWVHADEELVEVHMSEAQFANFITSSGIGGGVPCTLSRFDGMGVPACPPEHARETYESEVKEDLKELTATLKGLVKLVDEITDKPRLNSEDKAKLRDAAEDAYMKVSDSMPFLHQQFTEKMDKTVSQASAEITAHVQRVIQQAGLAKLIDAGEFPRLEQK
jgi:hypothetical protein